MFTTGTHKRTSIGFIELKKLYDLENMAFLSELSGQRPNFELKLSQNGCNQPEALSLSREKELRKHCSEADAGCVPSTRIRTSKRRLVSVEWRVCSFVLMSVSAMRMAHGLSLLGSGMFHGARRMLDASKPLASPLRSTSASLAGFINPSLSYMPPFCSTRSDNNEEFQGRDNGNLSFRDRQALYDQMRMEAACSTKSTETRSPSIWGFEALFPKPVWDVEAIRKDLYEVSVNSRSVLERRERAAQKAEHLRLELNSNGKTISQKTQQQATEKHSAWVESERVQDNSVVRTDYVNEGESAKTLFGELDSGETNPTNLVAGKTSPSTLPQEQPLRKCNFPLPYSTSSALPYWPPVNMTKSTIDVTLSRMVKDRVFGMRSSAAGTFEYDIALIDASRAVQFTLGGRRIGRSLKVNIDRLAYAAKRAFRKSNIEEAEDLYLRAIEMDPYDGRAYLGMARCAQQRQDLSSARQYLKLGISRALYEGTKNPFLLQALGTLEEKIGHLAEAEHLYLTAVNAQPSHAAAWVALAQLRTEKLRQGVTAGRICYETAEKGLANAGLPQSSYVYTAWASLEYKKAGNVKRARELFEKAIECDPKCSAAYLQLGVMEADKKNWDRAKECFEKVLKFDNRNSRVLQAFAIMESKRPDGDSRTAIGLFERALKVNPKDAGVFQAYALYVASLGDIDAARNL